MTRLTESAIEDFAIKLFERLSYDTIHAPAWGATRPASCGGLRIFIIAGSRYEPDC